MYIEYNYKDSYISMYIEYNYKYMCVCVSIYIMKILLYKYVYRI